MHAICLYSVKDNFPLMTHQGLCLFWLLTSLKEEQAFGNTLKTVTKLFSSIRNLHLKCSSYIAGQGKQECHMQADEEYKYTVSDLLIDLIIDQTSKQGQAIVK